VGAGSPRDAHRHRSRHDLPGGRVRVRGSIKLLGVKQSLAIRDHLGISPSQWRIIGLLEVGRCRRGVGRLGVVAHRRRRRRRAHSLLSVGAIVSHVRKSDTITDTAPAVVGLLLAVATAMLLIAR
jgi:hypothetical protein